MHFPLVTPCQKNYSNAPHHGFLHPNNNSNNNPSELPSHTTPTFDTTTLFVLSQDGRPIPTSVLQFSRQKAQAGMCVRFPSHISSLTLSVCRCRRQDKQPRPALLASRVLKSVTSSHLTATPRAVWTVEMHNVFNISAALH